MHRYLTAGFLMVLGLMASSSWAQSASDFRLLATPDVLNSETGGEILQVHLPPAWHTVHKEWQGNRGVKEVVPADQTIINWQEMLAFQVIDKVNMQPQAYVNQLRDALSQSCDFSHFRTLSGKVNSSYAETTQISWCGQVKEAAWGEIVLTRVIAGENTLYSLNKSWRTIPFRSVEAIGLPEEEIDYWSTELNRSRLCDTRLDNCQ